MSRLRRACHRPFYVVFVVVAWLLRLHHRPKAGARQCEVVKAAIAKANAKKATAVSAATPSPASDADDRSSVDADGNTEATRKASAAAASRATAVVVDGGIPSAPLTTTAVYPNAAMVTQALDLPERLVRRSYSLVGCVLVFRFWLLPSVCLQH